MSNLTKKGPVKSGVSIDNKSSVEDSYDNEFAMWDDVYALDSDLKKELKEKGLVARFLNAEKLKENGGRHPRGWVTYKRESQDAHAFGSDPEGYVRRGNSILGVKKIKDADVHKRYLAHKADIIRSAIHGPNSSTSKK